MNDTYTPALEDWDNKMSLHGRTAKFSKYQK